MSGTGSVSSITDSALAQVQSGTTPTVAPDTSVATAGTQGVSSGSVNTGTSYDTSSVSAAPSTDAQYATAAAANAQGQVAATGTQAQPVAASGSAPGSAPAAAPAQWNDAVRAEFTKIGLSPNQVAQVEALQLSQADVEQAYSKLAADPSLKAQIPDTPVGTPAAADGTSAAGGTPAVAGAQQQSAATGGGGIGQGAPAGPPAWSDEWRKKFVAAGAPAELIQQLTYTGAMGADATQLAGSLKQLKDTIDKELLTFRSKFPKAYEKLAKSTTVDRATFYQLAAAADSGQISQTQFSGMVDSANASTAGVFKDMFLKQFLPWTLIPGWGAVRMGISVFNGGTDPISHDKINLDFWNHGMTGWMDAAMAVGGATALFSGGRGLASVYKGLKFAGSSTGELGALAAREGLQNLSLGAKAKAFLPFTQTNKLATGFARLQGLDTNIKLLEEGSVARVAADSLYSKFISGATSLQSNGGLKVSLGGVFTDGRGIFMRRNAPLIEQLTKNGQSIVKVESRVAGQAGVALLAGAGVDGLSASQSGKLIAENADLLGKAQNLAGLRNLAIKQAGEAFKLTASSNPLKRALGIIKPGPLQDVLKVMAGKEPSALAVAFKNPVIKFGTMGAVGLGVGIFAKKPLMSMIGMGAQPAPAADAQKGAAQAQPDAKAAAAAAPGQLTADQQSAVQKFVAMPVADQQSFLQNGLTQLNMLTSISQGGAAPTGLATADAQIVQQFQAQSAAQQAATIQQYQGELELLAQAAKQAAQNGTSGTPAAGGAGTGGSTGQTQLKNGIPVSGGGGQQQATAATAPQAAAPAAASKTNVLADVK